MWLLLNMSCFVLTPVLETEGWIGFPIWAQETVLVQAASSDDFICWDSAFLKSIGSTTLGVTLNIGTEGCCVYSCVPHSEESV